MTWAATVAALSGVDCLAPDLPGHGSAVDQITDGSLDDLARPIETMLLAGEPAFLVGHSLGGGVALRLAARHPEAVKGLLLFAPLGLGVGMNKALLDGYPDIETEERMAEFLEALVFDRSLITPLFAEYALEQLNEPGVRDATRKIANQLIEGQAALQADIARIADHGLATTVFWGSSDQIIQPNEALIDTFARLVRLPNVGHIPHIEARDSILRIFKERLV